MATAGDNETRRANGRPRGSKRRLLIGGNLDGQDGQRHVVVASFAYNHIGSLYIIEAILATFSID